MMHSFLSVSRDLLIAFFKFSGFFLFSRRPSLHSHQPCKQEDLARALLHTGYETHYAMGNVKILSKLVSRTKMNAIELTTHSFPPTAVHNQLRFNIEREIIKHH